MKTKDLTHIYFIGIGGIGMSALARYFLSEGKVVAGYDKTATTLTTELERDGVQVHFKDDVQCIPEDFMLAAKKKDALLVVYTPAIPSDHLELNHFRKMNACVMKRSEVLGLITEGEFAVAVAGTHGKTTTSSMIAHMLIHAGRNCTAFLGGIVKNYDSNFLSANTGSGHKIVVVEADEYDRSFLTLSPDLSVITSMDPDHLDIYGDPKYMEDSYLMFAGKLKEAGKLFYRHGLPLNALKLNKESYSLSSESSINALNIRIENHTYLFDWHRGSHVITGLRSGLPGLHNVENAVAAIALAQHLGLTDEEIRNALGEYQGVRRRFDLQLKTERYTYIDDYAHHPEELRACITSVRELYPGKRILGIFQPHLFSRTRDFADGFAGSLSSLDELLMMDIYPAREAPIPGVSSSMILERMTLKEKALCNREKILEELGKRQFDVLVTLGAGDIDQLVEPIKKFLLSKHTQTVSNENRD